MIRKTCIFCASSQKVDRVYFQAVQELAYLLAKNDIVVQYGGGAVGMMGELAKTVMENNGEIIGVIPEFMIKMEWGNTNITELIVVKDMHERKRRLIKDVDAVIALPGGCGTLEELSEVITLKQLGQFIKPIIILNINKFFDPFIEFLNKMINEKFMREVHRDIWTVVEKPENVLMAIESTPEWDPAIIKIAQI